MPTVNVTPFNAAGSIHGAAKIDPGPSGGGSLVYALDIAVEAFGGHLGSVELEAFLLACSGSIDGVGTGSLSFGLDASIEGLGGGQAGAEVDFFVDATGILALTGAGQVPVDGVEVSGAGRLDIFTLSADVRFSAFTISGQGYAQPHGDGSIQIRGLVSGSGSRHVHGLCSVSIDAPEGMDVLANGWAEVIGSGVLSFASGVVGGGGYLHDRFDGYILRYSDR